MRRKLVVTLVLAVAVGGGLLAWALSRRPAEAVPAATAGARGAGGRPAGAFARGKAAVAVEVTEPRRMTLRELATYPGTLAPRASVQVSARVAGRLERLLVGVGDRVERGALLALLDSDEYEEQVEQARAEREVARANLEAARITLEMAGRDLERVKALREKKIASEAELDQTDAQRRKAEAQYAVAEAQLRQKEAALRAAEFRLAQTQIRAEWEGGSPVRVVGERFAEPGALLRANDPILSLLDIGSLEAVIQITAENYARLERGQRAEVRTAVLPGRTFAASVARIAPFLREATRQAEVRLEVPNPSGALKPGMPVEVTLELGRREGAVAVPSVALTTREDRRGVFVVDRAEGRARFVAVRTGVSEGEWVEVIEPPLAAPVVTVGQHLLEDGAPVTLAGRANGAGGGSAPGEAPPPGERRAPSAARQPSERRDS